MENTPEIAVVPTDALAELIRQAVSDANDNSARSQASSPWLTEVQAADYLGVSKGALRSMVARKQVPIHRTGTGRRRFRVDELDAFCVAGDELARSA